MDYFNDGLNGLVTWAAHLSQDTQDEVFWAGHLSNRKLRVFYWPENAPNPFYTCSDPRCDIQDIQISPWTPGLCSNTLTVMTCPSTLSSVTPDGQDWMDKLRDFPVNAILGATRAFAPPGAPGELFSEGLWLAWSAGADSNFPEPHVEMVTLDIGNKLNLIQQVQIWNGSYAFAYPALATNACTERVGLSLEGGGGINYENHLVGLWGDFVAYITTNSDVGTGRFGDYVTIRQDQAPNGAFFDAFGYGLNSVPPPGSGTSADIHYVLFGQSGVCPPPPTN